MDYPGTSISAHTVYVLLLSCCVGTLADPSCQGGSTKTAEESALMAFYHASGGDDWFCGCMSGDCTVPSAGSGSFFSGSGSGPPKACNSTEALAASRAKSNRAMGEGALNVDPYSILPDILFGNEPWTNGTDRCTWYGVGCSPDADAVLAVFLPQNNLIGTFSEGMAALSPCLAWIDLSENNLGGTLPPLPQPLRLLNLRGNQLEGSIPAELGQSILLEHFDITGNSLGGVIPEEICKLVQLSWLSLGSNNFTSEVPSCLNSINELQFLNLGHNTFYGALPDIFSGMSKLKVLQLQDNSFSGALPESIFGLQTLKLWGAGNNYFNGSLSSDFSKLLALTHLILSTNRFSGPLSTSIGGLTAITYLDLSSNGISGPLPSSMGNLVALSFIDFSANKISGPLPPSIGKLAALTHMDFSTNELSGPLPPSIGSLANIDTLHLQGNVLNGSLPEEIGQLTTMTNLDLSKNKFTGPLPTSIGKLAALVVMDCTTNSFSGPLPPSIGGLVNIYALRLADNMFSGTLPVQIGNLVSLAGFQAQNNEFTGPLPPSMMRLRSLQVMYLQNNRFNASLPEEIGDLTNMVDLDLSNNEFTGSLPASIGKLAGLAYLDCSNNSFSGPLPPSIASLTQLRSLHLSDNSFSGSLPPSIGGLIRVQSLRLEKNTFDGPLPAWIGNLVSALELHLQNNNFNGTLPEEIGALESLQILRLSGNSFTGTLPEEIGALASLRTLLLSSNNFTGPLPVSIGQLTALSTFYCDGNSFSGKLPEQIGNLVLLDALHLQNNSFSGSLPPSIGDLRALISLRMAFNTFTGSLPEEVGNLKSLLELDVQFNAFTGPLPTTIGSLENMRSFYLNNNNFDGNLPDVFGNLTMLADLQMANNSFTGPLPESFGKLGGLIYLDFSINKFNGTLPAFIGNLVKLERIFLYQNKFNGHLPDSIGKLTLLKRLYLETNEFTGPLPASIGNLINLEIMHINENKFSGNLPDEIGNLASLTDLGMYINNFSGPLPESIGNLSNMVTLLAGKSGFSGQLPSSLAKCTKLVTIVLSHNELSGSIPEEYASLTSVMHLHLDRNQLSGDISTWFAILNNMPKMYALAVHGNHVTGKLPQELMGEETWRHIVHLTLNENQLSGILPEWLCSLEHLIQLSLAMNEFEGVLPQCLSQLTKLQIFDIGSNKFAGAFPDILASPVLESVNIADNSFSGAFPTPSMHLADTSLLHLDFGFNQFADEVSGSLCNFSNLEFLMFSHNKLGGPLPDCVFESTSFMSLGFLSLSCQDDGVSTAGADLAMYQRCPVPFHLGQEDPISSQSVHSLVVGIPSLARIDLVLEENLKGENTPVSSIEPERATSFINLQGTASGVVLTVALLVLLGAKILGRARPKYGGLASLDRLPQLGTFIDTVQGTLQRHVYLAQPKDARSNLGGVVNIIRAAAITLFLINSVAQYCLEGMDLVQATSKAKVGFVPMGAFNFSMRAESAEGPKIPIVTRAQDEYLEDQLRFNGHASQADQLVQEAVSNGTVFSFPVGWEGGTLTRKVTLALDTALLTKSQFQWTVTSGSLETGANAHKALPVPPSVSGGVWSTPVGEQTCLSWPKLFDDQAKAEFDYSCAMYGDVPQVAIPGRASPDSIYGPSKLSCIDEVTFFVMATPTTQKAPVDAFAGTTEFERKTFSLTFLGSSVKMHEHLTKPGLWSVPFAEYPKSCVGCIEAEACPAETLLTVVFSLDSFGIDMVLTRRDAPLTFGPALLASCLSIMSVFVTLYSLIESKLRKGKKFGDFFAAAKQARSGPVQRAAAALAETTLLASGVELGNYCVYAADNDGYDLKLRPMGSGANNESAEGHDDKELLNGGGDLIHDLDEACNSIVVAILGRGPTVEEYHFVMKGGESHVLVHGLTTEPKKFKSLQKAFTYFSNPKVFPRPVAPLHHWMDWVPCEIEGEPDTDDADASDVESNEHHVQHVVRAPVLKASQRQRKTVHGIDTSDC